MNGIHLNPWAILVAAAAAFLIGGVWYSPILFSRVWAKAAGLSEEELRNGNMAKIFGLSFLLTLVMSVNLAAFLSGPPNVLWGMTAGALAGIGWVGTALGVLYLFEHRPLALFLVNAGYMAVTFVVMGWILGAWK
jgi:hypothetical protein